MNLDTVELDVEHIDEGQASVVLLWRLIVPDRDAFTEAEIIRG